EIYRVKGQGKASAPSSDPRTPHRWVAGPAACEKPCRNEARTGEESCLSQGHDATEPIGMTNGNPLCGLSGPAQSASDSSAFPSICIPAIAIAECLSGCLGPKGRP